MSRRGALLAAAGFALAALGAFAAASAPLGARGKAYLALHLVLSTLYVGILASRKSLRSQDAVPILLLGVVTRLALVPVPPFTSHDAGRYLWDGAVLARGFDPYRVPPDDPRLLSLRSEFPPPADNREVPTVYPPLSLAVFAGISAIGGPEGGVWLWKALVALASTATLLVVARHLGSEGRSRDLAILALSPLVVLEGGVGAHLDVLAALFVTLGLLALRRGRAGAAGAAIGAASALKLLPVVLLFPLAAALRTRGALRFLGGAVVAFAIPYAAAFAAGLRPTGSLPRFLTNWEFGSPAYFAGRALGASPSALRLALSVAAVSALVALSLAARRRGAAAELVNVDETGRGRIHC